ncbi:BgTH12-06822 [Blumeria graminis f. sp. triticale]|uniref:Exocyst complex component SEC5 n=3 Tax=Blumeria graminis TaxID=34373 RepID=A0A061HR42_BLUGR|nr:subunit of the exocyst complex [Blumeria graminis f. sp. tritici 96224]CAD6505890.1 BgTH12-06822 [Blumeria graminis f. sp. triticale]VDB94483.1 Bgt-2946 [Blumeria graminis f. sp. tritici]
MSEPERLFLEYYQLKTAFPTEWPAEKDDSEVSDEELAEASRKGASRKSRSRYSALVKAASNRKSYFSGSQIAMNGAETLVQRDEPDPLGSTDSVVGKLKMSGLPVQDNPSMRNKFLLSSTTFSPSLFLSQVHSKASTQDLLDGLDLLSRSIDQKSASLKVLVESNFERFVRAKATIDNVYKEMRYQGEEPTPVTTRPRPHSRHASRNSFRASSGNQTSMMTQTTDVKKKNALAKESEYGVLGIKLHLLDVSAKAEEVWGPALGGQETEDSLKLLMTTIEQYKEIYELSGSISDSIRRKDFEAIIEDYGKAKQFADEAKKLSDELESTTPSDSQIFQILLAARVWSDVEELVEDFKRDLWRKLISAPNTSPELDGTSGGSQDQHIELISILLELGVTDNPILVWLSNRYNHLKTKIQVTSDRSRVEVEIMRRRLANSDRPTDKTIATNLKSLYRHNVENNPLSIDSQEVIEFWDKIQSFLDILLSNQGILGEVTGYCQSVESFVDGKAQQIYRTSINEVLFQKNRLSKAEAVELRKGTMELVNLVRETIFEFFSDPPIDDISALFSPLLQTPRTPSFSVQLPQSNLRDPRMSFDASNMPPPSPKRGEAWEKYAFWPPWANTLSGVYHLGRFLVLIGTSTNQMSALFPDNSTIENLKSLVSTIRERCATALYAAWNRDAENFKVLEDWERSPEKSDQTKMPMYFGAFESAVLNGMQKILYISDAQVKPNSVNVVTPPSAKLLQMVRSQFVTTLYKSLAGLVENAEKSTYREVDKWTQDSNDLISPTVLLNAKVLGTGSVDSSDRNVRMLLTLSNLQALRTEIVPNLTAQFENAFSVKLTEETKTIRDVLGQIDARLFSSFTRPFVDSIRTNIRAGINSPSWSSTDKPREVRPYVYEVLLSLVLVHTQVFTTASSLTTQVLSYYLEQISMEILDVFKLRQRWTLPELMQATLDVEFISQILSQYTTEKSSDMQSQIYQELDKGTDSEARALLQAELPEMRAILKRLRDRCRVEFACFKRSRNRLERAPASSILSEVPILKAAYCLTRPI